VQATPSHAASAPTSQTLDGTLGGIVPPKLHQNERGDDDYERLVSSVND
jgi:hypothetical protein